MKKNIVFIIIFVFILLLFISLNYNIFLANTYFTNSNNYYKNSVFTWALDSYDKALNYSNDNNIQYNKWNTFYRLSENEKDLNKKIELLSNSINSYSWIINSNNYISDYDTEFNYEFVKKKLEELEKEQQKEEENKNNKDKEDIKENNQDSDKSQEQDSSNKSENSENQSENNESDKPNSEKSEEQKQNSENKESTNNSENKQTESTNSDEYKSNNQQQDNTQQLSSDDLNQIQDYIDKLKDEEKYNREYYNNVQPVSDNPFFDSFFDRWDEKDW